MITNIIVRTGPDFVNFFYEVPKEYRGMSCETHVKHASITLYIEGHEFEYFSLNEYPTYGRVYEKLLPPGEYTYTVSENVETPGAERGKRRETNEITGTFVIG